MEAWEWIVIAAAAGAVLLLLVAIWSIRRRRSRLQDRFGREYDRAVADRGRRTAERRLSQVERSHEELELKRLSAAARERYLEEWRQAETRFVSDPRDAVRAAENVVERALEDRGYPSEIEVEQRIELVAVDHPDLAERYRHGRAMIDRTNGGESTENLRKAMVDLRVVLEELLEERTAA
jgi:FtsZ-interacting cell division protein ZipA